MKKQLWMGLAGLVAATPLVAQSNGKTAPNEAIISAMGVSFIKPKCDIKGGGHFLVSSGATYYSESFKKRERSDKESLLKKADDVIIQAIKENKQDQNGGAWYWLGRIYFQLGDVEGGDSAFTRAEKLLPDCAPEINEWREIAYGAVMTPALEAYRASDNAKAIPLFALAMRLNPKAAGPYSAMASLYQGENDDSAVKYLVLAQEKTAEAKQDKEMVAVTGQLVSVYQRMGRNEDALKEARKVMAMANDNDAKRLLYGVLSKSNKPADQAEAKQIAAELTKAMEDDGSITAAELVSMALDAYNADEYPKAREYFNKALKKEPWRRDLQVNVVKVDYVLKNYSEMLGSIDKQLAHEPLSEEFYKLKLQALNAMGTKDTAAMNQTAILWSALPVGIYAAPLQYDKDGVHLVMEATGREATDPNGKAIPPAAQVMTLEFIDKDGKALGTQDINIDVLQPGAKQTFQLTTKAEGVVDFRYIIKKKTP